MDRVIFMHACLRNAVSLGVIALLSALAMLPAPAEPAKNIIICFGDGMGLQQMKTGECYLGRPLCFESFPYSGMVATDCADDPVTDSAAAATAIFAGHKVDYTTVGLALPPAPGFIAGQEYENIPELMQEQGKNVGIVTTCHINDATPAGFAAHELSRSNYSQILDDYFQRARPNLLWGAARQAAT